MPINATNPYPEFGASNATSITKVLEYASNIPSLSTGYEFTLGIVLLLFVFGVSFRAVDEVVAFDKRILSSLFLTTLTSVVLAALNILDFNVSAVLAILTFIIWFLVKE